ncbi:MAG: RagB/SusD family nutrient uptake outer membrane protein [Bacteroidales bacterium]|nr:RagB/SusD family nutrient uptake outer membrane protein [Bacteroidales bacterium]
MKKRIYLFAMVASCSMLSSCNDFLNEELKGAYTAENYYTTKESATMAVNAIYSSLYGTTLWIFGDVASDDAVKGGNAGDQADINFINDFSASTDNGVLNTFWQSTYETISRANNVISYVSPMSFDQTVRDRLVGEAKFLRAFSYFNLVNIFGKVPLKVEPQLTSATIHVGLSEVSAIYDQIEEDLTDAIEVLPASYDSETGRVTKGAAYGLLAKAKLYQKDYADCLTNIQALESLNQYDLVANYADLFKVGSEDSCETIFGIRYLVDKEATLGNNLKVWFAPSLEGGYYFDAPTQSYVDAFSEKTIGGADDPRLDASIGRQGKPWFNNTTFSSSWSEATGYLVKKYNEDKIVGVPISQCVIPYNYMRYADILLMKAEAINEIGGADAVEKAAVEVNKVRNRARLAPTTATIQSDMRTVIQNERRKELGFEFHRFFDLMRWGKATAEAALGSDLKWSEPRFYFPIPQSELDANQALQ